MSFALTSTNGSRLDRASAVAIALVSALLPPSTSAQSDGRSELTIDGSGPRSFEASIATLQNELPERRREDFEIALAVVWTRHTLGSGDLDRDGDVDADDGRLLANDVADLLADIQRGDILSAIENGATNGYTAADYLEQLNGLGYDEVLDLAGRPSEDPYFAALTRYRSQGNCGRQREQSVVRLKWCEKFSDSSGATFGAPAAGALNEAIQALNAQQYGEARAVLEELSASRLSPYERSKTEELLFFISDAEGKYVEARDHLRSAISAGGLSEQEAAEALRQIRAIDAKLAESTP